MDVHLHKLINTSEVKQVFPRCYICYAPYVYLKIFSFNVEPPNKVIRKISFISIAEKKSCVILIKSVG